MYAHNILYASSDHVHRICKWFCSSIRYLYISHLLASLPSFSILPILPLSIRKNHFSIHILALFAVYFLFNSRAVCARAFFPVSYHATFLCSIMFSSQYCKFILICSYCFATYVHLRYCCYYCGCRLTFVLGAKVVSFNLDKNHICRSIVCFACFE